MSAVESFSRIARGNRSTAFFVWQQRHAFRGGDLSISAATGCIGRRGEAGQSSIRNAGPAAFYLGAINEMAFACSSLSVHGFGCLGRVRGLSTARTVRTGRNGVSAAKPRQSRPGREGSDRRDCRSARYAAIAGEASGRTDWPLPENHRSSERTHRCLGARRCGTQGEAGEYSATVQPSATLRGCRLSRRTDACLSSLRSGALHRLPDLLSSRSLTRASR